MPPRQEKRSGAGFVNNMISDGGDALEELAGGSRGTKQAKRGAGLIGDVENFVGLGVKRLPRQPRGAGIFDDILNGVNDVAHTVGSVRHAISPFVEIASHMGGAVAAHKKMGDHHNGCNMKGYNKTSKFNDVAFNDATKSQFLKRHGGVYRSAGGYHIAGSDDIDNGTIYDDDGGRYISAGGYRSAGKCRSAGKYRSPGDEEHGGRYRSAGMYQSAGSKAQRRIRGGSDDLEEFLTDPSVIGLI